MKSGEEATCAFCRTTLPDSEEEVLVRMRKRVERKDPNALFNMSMSYGRGRKGLPLDQVKCIDLLRQSAALGCQEAQYQLGQAYDHGEMGLEQNEEEAIKYYEKAAESGHMNALHNLACAMGGNGDFATAMRHWRLAASGGYRVSMNSLITVCFEDCLLHHADLAETLQVFYRCRDEMRSEDRNTFVETLKKTGMYDEEYDL
jgi:TPR repeat protein